MFKPALMAVGGFRHRRSVVCRSFPPTNPPSSSAVPVSMAESILVHRCPRHSCTLLYIVPAISVSMAELLYIIVHCPHHQCTSLYINQTIVVSMAESIQGSSLLSSEIRQQRVSDMPAYIHTCISACIEDVSLSLYLIVWEILDLIFVY